MCSLTFVTRCLCCKQLGASSGNTACGFDSGSPCAGKLSFLGCRRSRCKPVKCSCDIASLLTLESHHLPPIAQNCRHLEPLRPANPYSFYRAQLRHHFLRGAFPDAPARRGGLSHAPVEENTGFMFRMTSPAPAVPAG